MKKCPRCQTLKSLESFSKDKTKANGLQVYCKICKKVGRAPYNAEYEKNWRNNNLDKVSAKWKRWANKNKNVLIAYEESHKAEHLARTIKYRLGKSGATPKWLSKEQLKEIEQFYIDAKELRWLSEEPLHVDHIIPIQGENVCGLHVPWNLQILPRSLNLIKSNKL